MLLCLDTASTAVSVALARDGELLAERTEGGRPRHAELLAPLIEQVLADAGAGVRDLTAIVAGAGPGPFTGLRVGLATARTLGFTLGIPVHGLCSLDAVAAAVIAAPDAPEEFLVAIDARRREVYRARYRRAAGRWTRTVGPGVDKPADVTRDGLPVAGRGALLYPELLGEPLLPLDPPATGLARLASALLGGEEFALDVPLLEPDPLYLRRPDATVPGERKPVRS